MSVLRTKNEARKARLLNVALLSALGLFSNGLYAQDAGVPDAAAPADVVVRDANVDELNLECADAKLEGACVDGVLVFCEAGQRVDQTCGADTRCVDCENLLDENERLPEGVDADVRRAENAELCRLNNISKGAQCLAPEAASNCSQSQGAFSLVALLTLAFLARRPKRRD